MGLIEEKYPNPPLPAPEVASVYASFSKFLCICISRFVGMYVYLGMVKFGLFLGSGWCFVLLSCVYKVTVMLEVYKITCLVHIFFSFYCSV